jgi:hypothetical protein
MERKEPKAENEPQAEQEEEVKGMLDSKDEEPVD